MDVLIGIICLLFLCGTILLLSAFAISHYQKKHVLKKIEYNDYYQLLFDVYYDNMKSPK